MLNEKKNTLNAPMAYFIEELEFVLIFLENFLKENLSKDFHTFRLAHINKLYVLKNHPRMINILLGSKFFLTHPYTHSFTTIAEVKSEVDYLKSTLESLKYHFCDKLILRLHPFNHNELSIDSFDERCEYCKYFKFENESKEKYFKHDCLFIPDHDLSPVDQTKRLTLTRWLELDYFDSDRDITSYYEEQKYCDY